MKLHTKLCPTYQQFYPPAHCKAVLVICHTKMTIIWFQTWKLLIKSWIQRTRNFRSNRLLVMRRKQDQEGPARTKSNFTSGFRSFFNCLLFTWLIFWDWFVVQESEDVKSKDISQSSQTWGVLSWWRPPPGTSPPRPGRWGPGRRGWPAGPALRGRGRSGWLSEHQAGSDGGTAGLENTHRQTGADISQFVLNNPLDISPSPLSSLTNCRQDWD